MPRSGSPTLTDEVKCLMAAVKPQEVGTLAMAEVDRELIPIIAELATLGPGNDQHPTVRQLFNWLADPQRTAKEFIYVLGPLELHVCSIMVDHFNQYVSVDTEETTCCIYLCKVAAEALAARCPVLEGSWETAAWYVEASNCNYLSSDYGFASDRFSSWIINIIGDPDLCPNSYLRWNLINLFRRMVNPDKHDQSQAIMSMMFTCSTLDLNHLSDDMDLHIIANLFDVYSHHGFKYDQIIADRLKKDLISRSSVTLRDVAFNHSINPNIYTQSMELKALIALLKTTRAVIRQQYKHFLEKGLGEVCHHLTPKKLSHTVYLLFKCFSESFQMPQLVEFASSCAMDFIEFVLLVTDGMVAHHGELLYPEALINTGLLLEELIGFNFPITRYYHERLSSLKVKLQNSTIAEFPRLYEFFYDVFEFVEDINDLNAKFC